MKKILLAISLFALILIIKTEAKAQTTATSPIAVTIATVTELTADNGGLATPFAFASITDLEAGITRANAVTLSYKSNKIAKVQIKAQGSGFFTGGTGALPVSALTYKKNGASGTPIALTTTNADLATELDKGTHSFGIDYTITPGLDADPATNYAIVVEYTLTAP